MVRILTVLLTILVSAAGAAAEPYKAGDRVAVVAGTALEMNERVVDRLTPGIVVIVRETDGDRLLVTRGKPGWTDGKHVVPLAKAFDHFTAALSEDPNNIEIRYARAMVSQQTGRLDHAIADYSVLLRREPRQANFWNARGNVRQKNEELSGAIADYDEAIRLEPDNAMSYNNRGNARYRQRDFDHAIEDYSTAIKLDSNYVAALHNRAAARQAKGDSTGALADDREALRLDPSFAAAHNGIAWILATSSDAAQRNGKEAVTHALEAIKLSPAKEATLLDTLGAAYAEAGNFSDAVTTQEETLKLAPQNEQAGYRTRLDLYKAGQPYHQAPVVMRR